MENQIGGKQAAMPVPPDGGARAWLVMLASFLCNGILFGVINTYSVIYVDLQKKLEAAGVAEASSKACEYNIVLYSTSYAYKSTVITW